MPRHSCTPPSFPQTFMLPILQSPSHMYFLYERTLFLCHLLKVLSSLKLGFNLSFVFIVLSPAHCLIAVYKHISDTYLYLLISFTKDINSTMHVHIYCNLFEEIILDWFSFLSSDMLHIYMSVSLKWLIHNLYWSFMFCMSFFQLINFGD